MTKTPGTTRILFTNNLTGKNLKVLEEVHFKFRQVPFIAFEYPDPSEWMNQTDPETDAWVFTSKRAIKAIKPVLDQLKVPDLIFAVGSKTARKLSQLSIDADIEIPEEFNVEALTEKIASYGLNSVTHFCGNLKSRVLKDKLESVGTSVQEIEVYQTRHSPKQVETRIFDGFVFMSPSAVESFFEENELSNEADIFCIGPSTGKAVDALNIHQHHLPEKSTFNSLIETIENFYS